MEKHNNNFIINHLSSGGMITNYNCTSSCGHCLYNCSPGREKDYIDKGELVKNLEKIMELGCCSIHIGGGEPFLSPEGLKMVIETSYSMGVEIEYVETNSSWYQGRDSAAKMLYSLKQAGLSTILVSMSPFHNECIPFFKVKGVIAAMNDVGMNVFPWIRDFYPEISPLDDRVVHSLSEYEEKYGNDYLKNIPSRYWIHLGGRALRTFATVFPSKSCEEIIETEGHGCRELLDTSHFHFDLYGNYIPGLCSGLAIKRDDLGKEITKNRYPILNILFHEGVRGFYNFTRENYSFKSSSRGYISKCHLCFDLRSYLVLEKGVLSRELQPLSFYIDE